MIRADFEGHGAALAIGDVVGAAEAVPGIYRPGPCGWYALRVSPQREDQAEAWLRRRGVTAFHPVLMRRTVRMGRVRDYARRYLPGYVFARFPGAPVAWRIVDRCGITGALCTSDGQWGALDPQDLRALYAMRKVDAESEADRRAMRLAARRAMTVRAGDAALFRAGPFRGFACEVAELTAEGGAVVRLTLLGRASDLQVPLTDLIPAKRD